MTYLNSNLILLRKSKGLEISDIATLFSIDIETIKKWEFGMQSPSLNELEKLASFYGITPSDLFIPINIPKTVKQKQVHAITTESPRAQEPKWRFWTWFSLTIVSIVLMSVTLGLFAINIYDVFIGINTAPFSHYGFSGQWIFEREYLSNFDLIREQSPIHILLLIVLLLMFVWTIISFILHIVGRFTGNTYRFINQNVSKTLDLTSGLLLVVIWFTAVYGYLGIDYIPDLFNVNVMALGITHFLSAFIMLLVAVKILAGAMLLWRDTKID
ncbi:MAG: helix-turn-helix domain-containing protein [Firmicutes bacterium]|nr:helix-turn-helix domain-containing protein [Bacillota bacterium]